MIVGETFVWGHLPKTGGDAVAAMFELVPELVVQRDAVGDNDKHRSFGSRPVDVAGKLLVANLRRLPAWTLSYWHHVARWGEFPDYRPRPLPSAEEMATSAAADQHLAVLTDGFLYPVDGWIRNEALAADFLSFAGRHTDVSAEQRRAVLTLHRVNVNEYDRDPNRWFTRRQLALLYASNPRWREAEAGVYSRLVV